MTELHIVPDARGLWRVIEPGARTPLSEHTSLTDAESAAYAQAEDRAVERVVIRDRYNRTHHAEARRALVRTGADDRRLDGVRDAFRKFARISSRY